MRGALSALLALGLVVFAPTTARAATCIAPPGTAAIEQYCEQVVAPGGKTPRPKSVPGRSVDRLVESADAGGSGGALLRSLGPIRKGGGADPGGEAREASPPPSDGTLGAVSRAVTQGLTLNGFFPAFLLALMALLAGWAWGTRRRHPS